MHNAMRMAHPAVTVGEYSFRILESHDARQHELALEGSRHAYHQVDRAPFHARMTELRLGPARILRDEVEHPIDYVGESFAGSLVFFVFIPRTSNAYWDGRPVDRGTLIKYPGEQAHRAFCSGPSECVGVLFDEKDFLSYARARGLADIDLRAVHDNLYLSDPEIVQRFLDQADRILQEAGRGAGVLENEQWRAQALESVRAMLLDVLQAGRAEPGRLPPPPTRAYIVEKAIGLMSNSLSDPPGMQRICDALRVSSRTLRYSFEEILGVSPTQYMLSLRLNAVRQKLLQGVPISTINRIAQDHGFGHMGRFAQFYREAFGELPSQTCRSSASSAFAIESLVRRAGACTRGRATHTLRNEARSAA